MSSTNTTTTVEIPSSLFTYVDESSIPSQLLCPLCHNPFFEPIQLPCEHVFCTSCITQRMLKVKECPSDRLPFEIHQLSPAPKMVKEMVNDLKVRCPSVEKGCTWTGARSSLAEHQKTSCPNPTTGPSSSGSDEKPIPDPTPSSSATKITLEPMTEFKSFNPADPAEAIFAMAHITAPRLKDLKDRKKPLSISAVIDVSGSMAGGKLQMAKDSLKFMIAELEDRDELGIIAFHTDVSETVPLTKMTSAGKKLAFLAVDSLVAQKKTNLSGGLFSGMNQVQHLTFTDFSDSTPIMAQRKPPLRKPPVPPRRSSQPPRDVLLPLDSVPPPNLRAPDTCRSVLLFTDGIANGGITTTSTLKQALSSRLDHSYTKDMTIHTFGFGTDHNAEMLQGVAECAGGSYYYIQDVNTMKESFADCLGGLLSTVAQNIVLVTKPAAGFKIEKVLTHFKQTPSASGSISVSMKDVYSCENRDIMFKIKPQEGGVCSTYTSTPVLELSLQYDSLVSGGPETVSATCTIVAGRKDGDDKCDTAPNKKVSEQRARLETTEAMEEAKKMANMGNLFGARERLCRQSAMVRDQAFLMPSAYLDAMLEDVDDVAGAMNENEWAQQGQKQLAQVQNCHAMQRMNRAGPEAKSNLGYDNEWKKCMRAKAHK